MKKNIYLVLLLLSISFQFVVAQDDEKKFEPNGKATGTVFFNYHYDLSKDAEKKSQFELLRSYLGYAYNFSEEFSTKIVFDVGYDERVDKNGKTSTSFSAFLKNAALKWKPNKTFAIEGGVIGTHIFDTQEKFYGYRYILESLQDKDKYYSSADLGVKATYTPIEKLEFHAGIWNGEGYKKIQDNFGVQKVSFDVVVFPVEGLIFKTYYDYMSKRDTAILDNDLLQNQHILNFFLGYEKKDLFRIGAEYDMQLNSAHKIDQELNGISVYGTFIIKKFDLFARYDQLASNTLDGATDSWNLAKDHSLILGGVQYAPVKGVKMALNYRHLIPRNTSVEAKDLIYLNLEYKF